MPEGNPLADELLAAADKLDEIAAAATWLGGLAEAAGEPDKAAKVFADAETLKAYGDFCRSLADPL